MSNGLVSKTFKKDLALLKRYYAFKKKELEREKAFNHKIATSFIRTITIENEVCHAKQIIDFCSNVKQTEFRLGKYITFSFSIIDTDFHLGIYWSDEKTESKLYSDIFGSHSGINEFTAEVLVKLLDTVYGMTHYSYAFDSESILDIKKAIDSFGYRRIDSKKEMIPEYDTTAWKKDIDNTNNALEFLRKLTCNKEAGKKADRVLEAWLKELPEEE